MLNPATTREQNRTDPMGNDRHTLPIWLTPSSDCGYLEAFNEAFQAGGRNIKGPSCQFFLPKSLPGVHPPKYRRDRRD